MWSRLYQACTECNTTEAQHYGGGLCSRCYKRQQYRNNPDYYKDKEKVRYSKRSEHIKKVCNNYYHTHVDKCAKRQKEYREQVYFSGFRDQVLQRDNYECQLCKSKDQLVVHHKDGSGRGSKTPNNDLDNLQTLCRSCHCIIHKPRLGTGLAKG